MTDKEAWDALKKRPEDKAPLWLIIFMVIFIIGAIGAALGYHQGWLKL